MMLQFHDLVKLKTKKIVFEDIFYAQDSGTLEQLKELSCKRSVIENSINKSSFITEAIAREISGGLTSQYEQDLQKMEQYLPLLENFILFVDLFKMEPKIVQWTSELKIRWTSALSSSSSFFSPRKSNFFQVDDLHFEMCMTLFLYGATLRERAFEILQTDLVQSATLFRKAAGVYYYLAYEAINRMRPIPALEKPIEVLPNVSYAMSHICLAEAQAVTIRKAEEKGNTSRLLAKLHFGVTQFLDQATASLPSLGTRELSPHFVDFISFNKVLHELKSQMYLAESLKSLDKLGVSIGVLREALNSVQKRVPRKDSWRLVFEKEIDIVQKLLKKYERENDFLEREKVIAKDELPVPEGKKIVSYIVYQLPEGKRPLVFRR